MWDDQPIDHRRAKNRGRSKIPNQIEANGRFRPGSGGEAPTLRGASRQRTALRWMIRSLVGATSVRSPIDGAHEVSLQTIGLAASILSTLKTVPGGKMTSFSSGKSESDATVAQLDEVPVPTRPVGDEDDLIAATELPGRYWRRVSNRRAIASIVSSFGVVAYGEPASEPAPQVGMEQVISTQALPPLPLPSCASPHVASTARAL